MEAHEEGSSGRAGFNCYYRIVPGGDAVASRKAQAGTVLLGAQEGNAQFFKNG